MFDVLVESTSRRGGARTWLLFAASSVVWTFVLAAVAVAGIFAYDGQLDADFNRIGLVAVTPIQPQPPRAHVTEQTTQPPAPANRFVAVTSQPTRVDPPSPHPPSLGPMQPGAISIGADGGRPEGWPGDGVGDPSRPGPAVASNRTVAPLPPNPPEPQPEVRTPPSAPKRPVSVVLSGIATKRVEPRYPESAKSMGVSGSVVVEVTVSETGGVLSTRVLSGHPLLRGPAEEAARGWRFTPTLLSGTPVRVIGTITFVFRR
jgi:protein TonB